MGSYFVVNVGKRLRVISKHTSASAAQKKRTKLYKRKYKGRVWIIGPRGMPIGPTTYGKRKRKRRRRR